MSRDRVINLAILLAAMALLIVSGHAHAANYPLQIIQPQPNLDTKSRFYKAYPGIPFEMRMGVIGGDYPFLYELTTAPSGMTINSNTGVITWPTPTTSGSPHTVTARVTDLGASGGGMGLGGTQQSVTWTIAVTTSGFLFVDAVNGHSKFGTPAGDGSISNPFRGIRDFLCDTNACPSTDKSIATYPDNFVYFRTGTYPVQGPVPATPENAGIIVSGGSKPKVWMEYPGESAVLDFSPKHGISVENERSDTYFSGFELINLSNTTTWRGIQTFAGKARYTFWKIKGHGLSGTLDGDVATYLGMLGSTSDFCCADYAVYQDNEFYDSTSGHMMVEYHTRNSLYEGNYVHDSYGMNGVGLKGGCIRCEVRGNTFKNIGTDSITGIGIWANSGPTTIDNQNEIRYNNVLAGTNQARNFALSVNQFNPPDSGVYYIGRNTFLGAVNFNSIDAANGPYYVYNNVIVNSLTTQPDHINCGYCTARESQIIATNNLTGVPTDNIIDPNGNLTSGYASFLGTRGHKLSSSPVPVPAAPVDLRVQ